MLKNWLFGDSRNPYYLVAPPYTEMSSGIRVLHYLCHMLNVKGQEAYITTPISSNSLRTPLLTEVIRTKHLESGKDPIVIYPEVISGNPFNARNIVRYLLNRPGFLGGDSQYGEDEFILQYRKEFVPEGMDVDAALYLPHSDLSLFNTEGVDEESRSGACYYVNRYQGALDEIPDDAIEISKRVPRTLSELATLFKTKELLYTYEVSAVALEASLCGCAVVYIPNPQMREFPHKDALSTDGAAWGMSLEAIERAKATVGRVREHYDKLIEQFTCQLERFIEKTQAYSFRPGGENATGTPATIAPSVAKALDVERLLGSRLDTIAMTLSENHRIDLDGREAKDEFFISVAETLAEGGYVVDPFEVEKNDDFPGQIDHFDAADSLLQDVLGNGEKRSEAARVQEKTFEKRQSLRYQRWIQSHGLQEVDGQLFAERMMYQWQSRPVYHFITFLFPGGEELLGDTLDSLSAQFYQDWRLTVIADTPAPDRLWEEIESVQWVQCHAEGNPYQLVNDAIGSVESDWVSFIEPGTRWRQHTLLRLGDYANSRSEWKFVYVDADSVDKAGERTNPRFLPDINVDMLRSMAYCRQGAWIRKDALLELGGIEPLPGCEMSDLAFKVIERNGEEAVGHIPDILVHTPKDCRQPDEAVIALSVKNHLERSGVPAVVGSAYGAGTLRINYVHSEEASVSVIIPTKDKFEYIESCVRSLLERTAYEQLEIIVADMGSSDPDTLEFYESVELEAGGKVSVLRLDAETNVAEAGNRAAMLARGEYVVFLKNHVEAKQAQWLSRIMVHAQRPEVGIVGPRIVSAESTFLFSAGLVLGMDDVVGKPFASQLTLQGKGYMGRAQVDQNYSAVSDTCLAIRKSIFTEVGGFDAEALGKDFLDVDLCLRVGDAGYKVVWTPFSIVMAYKGGASINDRREGRRYLEGVIAFNEARDVILKRWISRIANDPAYNPNLDLSQGNAFLVNDKLPLNWDVNFHERTRVLGLPLAGGSGVYRVIQPFEALSNAALQQTEYYKVHKGMSSALTLPSIARMDPDVMVVQAGIDDMHVGLLQDFADYRRDIFRVFTLDDLITEIPEKSSVYKRHVSQFRNARARLRKALSLCDRMIVTTRTLAEAYSGMIDDIRVIPNRLRRDVWLPLESKRGTGNRPRVGWVGAQQHGGDLEIIIDVVKQTADKVDWVFMGMCPEEIRTLVKEAHLDWVAYDKYPEKMASLNLDIAVAPLEMHRFNEAKSNLRLLEYGILGWPVVCTDIAPYQTLDAPVRRVPNDTEAWIEAIMGYANNLQKAASDGDRLRKWVKRHFILEDHLDEWVRALTPVNSRVSVVQSGGKKQVG